MWCGEPPVTPIEASFLESLQNLTGLMKRGKCLRMWKAVWRDELQIVPLIWENLIKFQVGVDLFAQGCQDNCYH